MKKFMLCLFCFSLLDSAYSQVYTEYDSLHFIDGLDTIDFVYIDSSDAGSGLRTASYVSIQQQDHYSSLRGYGVVNNIMVSPGFKTKTVQQGLIGYHLGGIFDKNGLYNDTSSSLDQWEWASDLAPDMVRFPAGANSRFSHPFHKPDGSDAIGYGYELAEIIKYFDATDGDFDDPTVADAEDDNRKDSVASWMDTLLFETFDTFRKKWIVQQTETHRYLDDFISMIQKIETENPGHVVNIIVCLNILSETATECKAMIQYLRSNPVHNCTVAGVEMGNECYFDFFDIVMGFEHFEDYYLWLNGGIPDSMNTGILPAAVAADHNYIHKLKSSKNFDVPIGLVAENLDASYVFREIGGYTGPRASGEWNAQLRTHYSDYLMTLGSGSVPRKKFNAVILHPYYASSNWESIPFENLDVSYPCIYLGDADTTNDKWTYGIYDERLGGSFDNIAWDFRSLYNTGYQESYDQHNTVFEFGMNGDSAKQLWTTEWNMKALDYPEDSNQLRINVYTQGFIHGTLVLEWALKNIKLNYKSGFKNGFFTYASIQNFAGATGGDLLFPADSVELEYLGKYISPYNLNRSNPAYRNYHMKRTTFYSMQLLSEITRENLLYYPTNFSALLDNPNVQPTMFIDSARTHMYLYYSNVSDKYQKYVLNPAGTYNIYPGAKLKVSDTATIYCVDASKPYSTAGEGLNTLYTLNECYDEDYPIEITSLDTLLNQPNCSGTVSPLNCLSAPPYSFGFFKIPIEPDYSGKESSTATLHVDVYPNPAHEKIYFTFSGEYEGSTMSIQIFDITGKMIEEIISDNSSIAEVVRNGEVPGLYLFKVLQEGKTVSTGKFVWD
ncbi:MAG: T9SS type A sorting domain-containing protein [Chitinophagales bacterium]